MAIDGPSAGCAGVVRVDDSAMGPAVGGGGLVVCGRQQM